LASVENLTAYVFKIAHREAARLASRRMRERGRRSEKELSQIEGTSSDGGQSLESAEMLAAALARLSPGEREVIELKMYGGLVLREISEVTGLPQGTVATHYRTAIERLRTMLAKNLP
jgi:RNA polymerase sigma-70 factor (ECF subfamily)